MRCGKLEQLQHLRRDLQGVGTVVAALAGL